MAKSELRTRYKAFADAYLSNGGNAYRAALAAGYSESFAKGRSYELLDREEIQGYLTRRRQQMAKRAVSPERVLLELADIGFGQRNFPAYDMFGNEYQKAPGMNARLKALELMGKNLGLFGKDSQETPEGVTIIDDIPE